MVMSAKADLTHVCWALRPAASQTLQQSASAEDQLHLAFRGGHLYKLYHKNQTNKQKKGGHHVAAEACLYDLVTTGHDHLLLGYSPCCTRRLMIASNRHV